MTENNKGKGGDDVEAEQGKPAEKKQNMKAENNRKEKRVKAWSRIDRHRKTERWTKRG